MPNQQCQSTEGNKEDWLNTKQKKQHSREELYWQVITVNHKIETSSGCTPHSQPPANTVKEGILGHRSNLGRMLFVMWPTGDGMAHCTHQHANGRHQTSSLVLPPGESPSTCPICIAFACSIMDKHDIIHKTGSTVGCVVQRQNIGLWAACFRCPVLTCSWWATTYVGKPSAIGQPTRPTKPFILSRSIN